MKIAVIGSGISGNVAAYYLSRRHDVTLFEKRDRLGGHSATVDIAYHHPDDRMSVDTGFIVYNELNYPGLTRLFAELGVETEQSNMSFGFSANSGELEWSGQSLSSVFAQKR
ncbi:MAG: FAD-dependent oxidoreductase, partial [Pseudomonadota bacterium]|nr:FAD-dependent oxidoreductase [Pseudomonadota bacterium]